MDLQAFLSDINGSGLAKPYLFDVIVNGPVGLGLFPNLTLRAFSTSFPGRQALTIDYQTYGPTQKVAYGSVYGDVDLSIILSPDHEERKYFLRWQDRAIGFARGTIQSKKGLFNVGYYDTYKGGMEITQFTETDDDAYTCELLEAWPVAIGPVQVDWNDNTSYSFFQVSMAYRYFVDDDGWAESQMEDDEDADEDVEPDGD